MNSKANSLLPEVAKYWTNGANCAQSSASGLLELCDLDIEAQICFHAFHPFGGGFKEGDCCGIVSGSLAALSSVLHARGKNKDEILHVCEQFRNKFRDHFETITCYGLTDSFRDISHQPIEAKAVERRLRCDDAMAFGTNLAMQLLTEEEKT